VLTLRTIAFGIPWNTRRFRTADVQELRCEPLPWLNRDDTQSLPIDPGAIAFDHGARTVRFGRGLGEHEARIAVAALCSAAEDPRGEPIGPTDVHVPATRAPAKPRHRFMVAPGAFIVRMPFGNTPFNRSVHAVSQARLLMTLAMVGLAAAPIVSAVGASPRVKVLIGGLYLLAVTATVVSRSVVSLARVETARLSGGTLELTTRPVVVKWLGTSRIDIRTIDFLCHGPAVVRGGPFSFHFTAYNKEALGQIEIAHGGEHRHFGQYVDAPEAREIVDALNAELARDPATGELARAAREAARAKASVGARPPSP
jgi:hypothetical protein